MMDDAARRGYRGGNHLIDSIPQPERDEVVRSLTMMAADETSSGISRGDRINALYFPVDAVFSVLVELTGGHCYEVDTIGREGLVGGEAMFGADAAPRSVICQIGGTFAQMPIDAFHPLLESSPAFRAAVNLALQVQWYRTQQTIACNVAHTLMQRCARWILLTRDEAGTDEFTLRAEYLSMMAGVQRQAVIEPMAALAGIGAIRYSREVVTIVSERRLREAACECYAAPREYAKRFEAPGRGSQRTR